MAEAEGRASAAVDGYFGWGVEAAFLNDRRYVARSASSWPLSVGSLMPCFVAWSSIDRLWFHIAATRAAGDPTTFEVAKSAATLPPFPRTEWQATQPLVCTTCCPRALLPAAGSK